MATVESESDIRVPCDEQALPMVLGEADANVRLLEDMFSATVAVRDAALAVRGRDAEKVAQLLRALAAAAREGQAVTEADVKRAARAVRRDAARDLAVLFSQSVITTTAGKRIRPRTSGQAQYVAAMAEHNLVFCIGPAGTGKTYLAMAMAVAQLRAKRVGRIVLTKPVVEAGESLGYLPGDLVEKVDPYMRPLYDALDEMVGPDRTQRHMERRVVEVLPLAYMRGRTLNDAFSVLDEAQNTTPQQMKMFLTRMGFGAQMVVTGDVTQIDLPESQPSGLVLAGQVLRDVKGVAFVELSKDDVVRHPLVHDIIEAYESNEGREHRPGS
ncbi:MAG: PhoH family protein [Armatimonadota bacterium]